MIKTLWAAFAAFILISCTGASSARDFPPNPALFVARDADSTMYLFGTLHLRRPDQPWGGPRAQAALAETQEVWTELEISPESDAQTQNLALRYGLAEPGHPLSSHFNAAENARIAAVAQRYGMQPNVLEAMKPWLAGITLAVLPMVQAGYDPNAGADRAIDAFADAHGKTMRAFETPEDQVRMLAGFNDAVQRQMVIESIDETEQGSAEMDAMARAWSTGDLRALERLVVSEMRHDYPDIYRVLLVDRNNAWVQTLTHELQGSGVDFVAVGAGHMLGHDGVIAQLRRRGYRVERIE